MTTNTTNTTPSGADALRKKLFEIVTDVYDRSMQIDDAVNEIMDITLPAAQAVAGHCYVQPVPDHCDRVVWRNIYYHLPTSPLTAQAVPQGRKLVPMLTAAPSAPAQPECKPLPPMTAIKLVLGVSKNRDIVPGTTNWALAVARDIEAAHGITEGN